MEFEALSKWLSNINKECFNLNWDSFNRYFSHGYIKRHF